jgi:hypothetical protein
MQELELIKKLEIEADAKSRRDSMLPKIKINDDYPNASQSLLLTPRRVGGTKEEKYLRNSDIGLKERLEKLQMSEARHRELLAYASMDYSTTGLQNYDDKILYNNQRYKKSTQPMTL